MDDVLVKVTPMLAVGDWAGHLAPPEDEAVLEAPRRHERTGRAPGGEPFIEILEAALTRPLKLGNRGPKSRQNRI